jgi:hypothetical protein
VTNHNLTVSEFTVTRNKKGEIAISPEKIAHHHPVLAKLLYHQKKLPKLLYHQKKLPKLLYHQKLLPKLLYHQKQLQYHQKKPIAPPKLQHHHRNARKLLPPPKNAIHPSKIVCTSPSSRTGSNYSSRTKIIISHAATQIDDPLF